MRRGETTTGETTTARGREGRGAGVIARSLRAHAVVLAVIAAGGPALLRGQEVVLPGEEPAAFGGVTLLQWSERWLRWIASIPEELSPRLDRSGARCALNQERPEPVFFLADAPTGTTVRQCAIPDRTYLFFPIGVVPAFAPGVADCEALCRAAEDELSGDDAPRLLCTVDGVDVPDLLEKHRLPPEGAPADCISLDVPRENIFRVEAGSLEPVCSRGYWVMLAPLPPGFHVVRFGVQLGSGRSVDVTYNLLVGATEVAVDDGTLEDLVATAPFCVNRLTPPSYPARLARVSVFFPLDAGIEVGQSVDIVTAVNEAGGRDIDRVPLQKTLGTVRALGEFNSFNVPSITIDSGDFIVGCSTPEGGPGCPLDIGPPSAGRSYVSSDGVDFEVLEDAEPVRTGNWMIRARVFSPRDVEISPSSLDFGESRPGTAEVLRSFAVTNKTDSSVRIVSADISDVAAGFAVNESFPFELAPREERSLSVGFTPGEKGEYEAVVFVVTERGTFLVRLRATVVGGTLFHRGDANGDGAANIADAQYLLNFLFLGGPTLACQDAADVNDDGQANIADAQYLLNHLFLGGPKPPAPHPDAGEDPTADDLDCVGS